MYLMDILDIYMFRPLLAICKLCSRELKVLLYTLCAHMMQRSIQRALLRNVISICGVAIKYILIDIVVFDYIPFPIFTHATGMTYFQHYT